MQTNSRLQSLSARFSASKLRTSLRRSSSSSSTRSSYTASSGASSPVGTFNSINSIIFRQPSIVDLEEERRSFASELSILEPRPVVYWGSVEERISCQ